MWCRGERSWIDSDNRPCENRIMRKLWNNLRVGTAWLTAFMLMIAATPHFRCVCPDGNVKLFCLNVVNPKTGCCCGGKCCSAKAGGQCCCSPSAGRAAERREEGCRACDRPVHASAGDQTKSRLEGSGCRKTLDSQTLFVASTERLIDRNDSGLSLFLPVADTFVALSPFVVRPFSWHNLQLPPPTDLVIFLQHFLI